MTGEPRDDVGEDVGQFCIRRGCAAQLADELATADFGLHLVAARFQQRSEPGEHLRV